MKCFKTQEKDFKDFSFSPTILFQNERKVTSEKFCFWKKKEMQPFTGS